MRWRLWGGRPEARTEMVFIGDSITQFWSDQDPALFRRGRINAGISGETTAQMLARFDRDVIARQPRIVHIMGGTNDLWHGSPGAMAETAIANLIAMATVAQNHDVAVILAAPPPIAPYAETLFGYAELFPVLSDAVRAHCQSAGLNHVDYAQSLVGDDGILRAEYTTDGVHLTQQGYRAMRRQAEGTIRAAR